MYRIHWLLAASLPFSPSTYQICMPLLLFYHHCKSDRDPSCFPNISLVLLPRQICIHLLQIIA